jgi:hypothetical protein
MIKRINKALVAVSATLVLGACDGLLDVSNPNNLVEEDVKQETAAAALANGALARVARAVSIIWQPYSVVSDEFFWIGSRDAWLGLDQGYIANRDNEFTDAAFPPLGDGRWMADFAIENLQKHVAATPTNAMKSNLVRANTYAGAMYMVIGEVQEDFAFSNKTEAGPAVGPDKMHTVLDKAITYFDAAVTGAREIGNKDLELRAMALRARAKHSRAIWDQINPSPKAGTGLVGSPGAASDAQAALALGSGDWRYDFTYSATTVPNDMADWINSRKENQVDLTLVGLNAARDVEAIVVRDPIDNVADPAFQKRLEHFRGGAWNTKGVLYTPLTMTSARLMHLILAEDALSKNDNAGFTMHVNHVRALDGLTPYAGQIPALDMLRHARRVNTFVMGLRLADMYRFGIKDARWAPGSDAVAKAGMMLPITRIECRANPLLSC